MKYSFDEIKEKIGIALQLFLHKDNQLLEYNVNERAISHKLAEYIQILFPEWDVDCEYNRRENDIKRLNRIKECDEQRKTDIIYPDIIVHHRGEEDNLLVIEIKTNGQDDICDRKKLQLLTQKDGEYGYDWGLYLQFNRTNQYKLTWYENGRIIREEEII